MDDNLFYVAVATVLNNWTALQLAVEHQLAGAQSKEIAAWMITAVETFFKENEDVIGQEVGDFCGDIMNNEYNTLIEDGSLEEIGDTLCKYFKLIKTGKVEEVKSELAKYKGSGVHLCSKVKSPSDTEADVAAPLNNLHIDDVSKHTKNEPDEDGWITVSKGKK